MDSASKFGVGISFCLIIIAGLTLNGILFIVYSRRKQLRQATKYFIINLALVDIISAVLWTSFSAVSALMGSWPFSTTVCQLQEFAMSFCFLVNMHTFMILALERCLLLMKPSRHREICMNTVIIIVIVSLWIFDGIISIFPFTGWGEISYFENQFQCSMDTEKNTRQMRFATAIGVGIPFIVMTAAYIVIFVKIRLLKKANPQGGQIVLEQDDFANGDSYAARLRRQQLKFQNAGLKKKKPVLGLKIDDNGYARDESSDDEKDASGDGNMRNTYFLYNSDVALIKTYALISGTYLLMWLPYIIVTYILTFDRYHGIPDPVFYIFVIFTHCVAFVKPLIYVIQNENFRSHLKKTFKKNEYRDFGQY